MKILSKKKCDEILKNLIENEEFQAEHGLNDMDAQTKATANRAMIAFMVGGVKGMHKILDTAWNYMPNGRKQKVENKCGVGYTLHVEEEPRTLKTVPLDWEDWIFNDKDYQ